ncbi:MAG: response regulator [Candidatus Marinimicrobia bacterium]|nr:response regulator [Candidatus Neomarinimicrobiota bacterium]
MNNSEWTPKIVIVDDEELVLTSLSSFLSLETEYEVTTFTSAEEALKHLENSDVDLVMSDFLMPEMDGISFLSEVRKLKPEIPRIILTGYADKENAIKAINEVGLFQYLEKPWDNDNMLIVLRNGLEKQRLIKELRKKISEVEQANSELDGLQNEIVKAFI